MHQTNIATDIGCILTNIRKLHTGLLKLELEETVTTPHVEVLKAMLAYNLRSFQVKV